MKCFPASIAAGSTFSLWSLAPCRNGPPDLSLGFAADIPGADQLGNMARAGARYGDSGQRASYVGSSLARRVVKEADDSNPDFR